MRCYFIGVATDRSVVDCRHRLLYISSSFLLWYLLCKILWEGVGGGRMGFFFNRVFLGEGKLKGKENYIKIERKCLKNASFWVLTPPKNSRGHNIYPCFFMIRIFVTTRFLRCFPFWRRDQHLHGVHGRRLPRPGHQEERSDPGEVPEKNHLRGPQVTCAAVLY